MEANHFEAGLPLRQLDVLEETEPRSAAVNMALDEALLEFASKPTLRFYRWLRPALSFGYFGRFSEVADEIPRRDVVRRWTGGGIVLHGADVTYSLIIPRPGLGPETSSRRVYSYVHTAVQQTLGSNKAVLLATTDAPKVSDACFANAVTADVLADGRKIAGAAQRRTRAGLLHQGSIQYSALPLSFATSFAAELCRENQPTTFTAEVHARAEQLAATKYSTAAWLRRH